MRLLVIDKTAVLEANHERYEALASYPGVELSVFGPERWFEHGRNVKAERREHDAYRISTGYAIRQGHYASGMYLSGLRRAIRRAKPDIIQLLEEPWSFFASQTMRHAQRLAPDARLVFYTWENVYRGNDGFDYVSRLRRSYRKIDQRMHQRAAGAICATDQAREVLRLKGFDKPMTVIPYGVGQAFFAAGERRLPQAARQVGDVFTVGYIGRLLEMKGVHQLIEALVLAPDIRLKIVGGGAFEPQLRAQTERLKLVDRVEFLPPKPPEEIPALLGELDALVLPSQTAPHWSEQLGRVVIEAMAAAVPVIASDSGALPEVLDDAGVVFREGKARELAERLVHLRDNEDVRRELVHNGLARARARFSWERFAKDLLAFYTKEHIA